MLFWLLFCKNGPYKSQEKQKLKKYTLYKCYLQSKLKPFKKKKSIKQQAANSLQWKCKLFSLCLNHLLNQNISN